MSRLPRNANRGSRNAAPPARAAPAPTRAAARAAAGALACALFAAAADARPAARRSRAPILLLHGTNDWLVPHEQTLAIHEASPHNTGYVLYPGKGHAGLWLDRDFQVRAAALAWFNTYLR